MTDADRLATDFSDDPIVNVGILQRDAYLLGALLLADRQIAENTAIREVSNSHFEGEVNRLLVLTAVLSRQLMELDKLRGNDEIARRPCGQRRFEPTVGDPTEWESLSFRDACNSIIHTSEIEPYSPADDDVAWVYFEEEIHVLGTLGRRRTHAQLLGVKFVELCIILATQFQSRGN